jgi:putative transposase
MSTNRHGFDALKPGFRSDRGKSRKITPELERAILEKVEAFPRMKGSVIYDQLAEEGKLSPAHLSRSTFLPLLGQSAILKKPRWDGGRNQTLRLQVHQ